MLPTIRLRTSSDDEPTPDAPRPAALRIRPVARLLLAACLGLGLALGLGGARLSLAANPPAKQIYLVPLPEEDVYQLFESNDAVGYSGLTFSDPIPPLRSVTSISIEQTGTIVYYDQWEDGGYDADIANPGGNVYDASTNPDGTQIWGDGDLANGCAPRINNGPNPCAVAADDLLVEGDAITLDNNVNLEYASFAFDQFSTQAYNRQDGSGLNWTSNWTEVSDDGSPTSGLIYIDATNNNLRFDDANSGDAIWREVDLSGATSAYLTFFIRGVNLDDTDDMIIQASGDGGSNYTTLYDTATAFTGGVFIVANITPYIASNTRIRFEMDDSLESGDVIILDNVKVGIGEPQRDASVIYFDGGDKFGATEPVATTRAIFPLLPGSVMAGAAGVLDRSRWGTHYVSPLGEDSPVGETSAFEDVRWFVMAGPGGSTIDVDANGDGDVTDPGDLDDYVLAQGEGVPIDGIQEGAELDVVSGGVVQVHLMTSDVDDTYEFRWGFLLPFDDWGNSYYSPIGTDLLGSNQGCTEAWIYNPNTGTTENYQDQFASQSYGLSTGSLDWTGQSWIEEGDGASSPTAGTIQINAANEDLRFLVSSTGGDAIRRTANTSGYDTATLSFTLDGVSVDNTDDIAVEVSSTGGAPYTVLETYEGSNDPGGATESFDITSFISSNTTVRFRMVNTLETGESWIFDDVNIELTTGSITINIDRPGGGDPDATIVVPSQDVNEWPGTATNLEDEGFRMYSAGGEPFLPFQIVDCTKSTASNDGRFNDWGNPLFREQDLTDEVLVGWAPGCSNESYTGVCLDPPDSVGGSPNVTNAGSRNVVWITALNDTTIYVDTDGSGIDCDVNPAGDAEQVISASELVSYRLTDDPDVLSGTPPSATYDRDYVHDDFPSTSYSNDTSLSGWGTYFNTWSGDWTETGDSGSSTTGEIQINTTEDALRLQDDGGSEAGSTIYRQHNVSGADYARLSFRLQSAATLDANDDIAVDISDDGGATWTTLEVFEGPCLTCLAENQVYNVTDYIASNMRVRFRIVDDLEAGDFWQVDDVHIDYAVGGDFDMSGSRIKTCDGTLLSAAYGQNPDFSGGNDEEALDLGTGIAPFVAIDIETSSIGDYVWLDENADGVQDAGEAGIPNVRVTLTGNDIDGNPVSLETYTDSSGGYLFPDLRPSDFNGYTVTVDTSSLPAGLAANPTYDEDGIGTPHVSEVILGSGVEHTTADFGYDWAPPTDVTDGENDGAIGDRLWIDANGDGVQDANEIGLEGVDVELVTAGPDGIFGTADDVVAATDTTDDNGNYIFDDLPAGAYVVRVDTGTLPGGYTQTGDPDASLDDATTSPILLGPGDVYLEADFGYQPGAGTFGTIGDQVWVDADRDGTVDLGEPGIPSVTVALIKDLNGNGVWDAGEPIVATDITDENGLYEFTGLPIADGAGTDDYLVWVNDTRNVLNELEATYDADGAGTPASGVRTGLGITAVTDLDIPANTTADTDTDFGYAPAGHDALEGMIGDTVFLDRDGDGNFDPGEGLEGVTVNLLNDGGQLVASTKTDENGNYYFGGLAAGTYTVRVDTSTLPNDGIDLTNTVDPDSASPGDSESEVTLSAGEINLDQDFGYVPGAGANTLSGTVWRDSDADGTLEGSEPTRFEAVTIALYEDSNGNGVLDGGDALVGTTSTDSNGDYEFENLPDGTYFVDVTDDLQVLDGLWHSDGPNDGNDNNSQDDPYEVTLSGGQTDTTGDFGYYDDPAAIGDFVWHDLDGDGIQDAGEPGIPGVEVTLTITWPDTSTTTVTVLTDADGGYAFENLLLDENYDGVGPNEPTYEVSVATPAGFLPAPSNQGGDDELDSDGSPTTATVVQGETDNSYDFGFVRPASIGDRVWLDEDADGVQDAGEPGIPNVVVELQDGVCTSGVDCPTTVTDLNGEYLFDDVPPGTYTVEILSGLPPGVSQTFDPDEAGVCVTCDGTDATVTVDAGDEHVTSDFGYNYNPPDDVNDNMGVAALGDRVWIDANGDGVQDANEAGLGGVTLELVTAGPDGLFGTGDDVVADTTVTDATGFYLFDGLTAGAYVVRAQSTPAGYSQTGDPDQPNATCTTCDNATTAPVVLAPGDVYLNADFGYQPTGDSGTIGDRVWLDADVDGTQDAGETGIPGVSVALIRDLDGDGVWDAGEPIIATDITDENGNYLFEGLPITDGVGTDDYLVWVNDTRHVLGELEATYDNDGAAPGSGLETGLGITAVTNLQEPGSTTADTDTDFGYAPPGHDATSGLIGDTVFLDRNGDGNPDPGEGLEGVTVRLYRDVDGQGDIDPGEPVLAVTTTDENGNYYFGGLDADDYVVEVVTSTLPGGGAGLTNTVDPDTASPGDSLSAVSLSAGEVNLDQDFGYEPSTPNTIGGTIWEDRDADGTLEGTEPTRFEGVTVVLRDSDGNIVGTTSTDANGDYSFTGLPDGTYTVDVTDDDNVLDGHWHSDGPNDGADDNSQDDPYSVTVSGGQTDTTGDFGYYRDPASVGNFVWEDQDGDGIQDPGEPGIENVPVTLTITYPNGAGATTLMVLTDSTGRYSFDNLLLDEDFDGAGGGEPTYEISFGTPSGLTFTQPNQGSDLLDSDWDGSTAVAVTPLQGQTDTSLGNVTDAYAGVDAGFTIRDLQVDTDCFDYTGSSPFTIARDTVTHDNAGGNSVLDATGLQIVHTLPAEVSYSSYTSSEPAGTSTSCNAVGQTVTCTLTGTFSPGDTWTVDYIVTFGGGALANVSNTAALSIAEVDVDAANDNDNCASTLPVTVSYFATEAEEDGVRFTWRTATEAGNVGFHLYEILPDGERRRLNDELIPSQRTDSMEPLAYELTLDGVAGERFEIEDVAWNLETRAHGSFSLGKAYGRHEELAPIDWDGIRAEHETLDVERRAVEDAAARRAAEEGIAALAGARTESASEAEGEAPAALAASVALAKLRVSQNGIQRVTYEELEAAGIPLVGLRPAQLALIHRGEAIPIRVESRGASALRPGDYIEFFARAADTLYTQESAYYLHADPARALRVDVINSAPPRRGRPASHYMETRRVENDRAYSVSAPNGDPWYDERLLVYREPKSWEITLDADHYVDSAPIAPTLRVETWGVTNWPGAAPDHRLAIDVNGTQIADDRFDGLVEHNVEAELPPGLLQEGENTLSLRMPADSGYAFDLINYDAYELSYPRAPMARDGALTFEIEGDTVEVGGLPEDEAVVYRLDEDGPVHLTGQRWGVSRDGFRVTFPGAGGMARYAVSTVAALASPAVEPARPAADLLGGPADYLVISHPSFLADIQPLVAHHEGRGLRVKVVDARDVYEQFGHGEYGVEALRAYLAAARDALGYRFVLLVGGDSYDYLGHTGASMSFLPTPYARTDAVVAFAPLDPLLVDFDGDGVQDAAIGRMPVRTPAELQAVVAKTLAYASKDYSRTALFASDGPDGSLSFHAMSEDLIAGLPAGWQAEHASVEVDGVKSARATLLMAIDEGVALTSFLGHSGPTAWTFKGLFKAADVSALNNADRPTVVTQWGCWNAYHVAPSYDTLGHRFLLQEDKGAAAVLGATTLTQASSERRLGERMLPRLSANGATIGEAILKAKQDLAQTAPHLTDVLQGWSLLGDPAAVIDE